MDTRLKQARRLPQAERREQLIDVAEALFVEHGYAGVTMEDIARAAGVTRPLAYNHFGTKEGVFAACIERASEAFNERLLASVDPDAAPREQLRQGAEVFFELLETDRGRWSLIYASSSVIQPEGGALDTLRFSTIELLVMSAAPDASPARMNAVAHAMSGVAERLGHWWLSEPTMTRDEIVDHFTDILWGGLALYVEG